MLPMFAICSSSRIFSRRAFSSGVRFFLTICKTSCVVLLFYITREVYTKFRTVSHKHINNFMDAIHSKNFRLSVTKLLEAILDHALNSIDLVIIWPVKVEKFTLLLLLNTPNEPFYFITSICTVLLLTPNFLAAFRTVVLFSRI